MIFIKLFSLLFIQTIGGFGLLQFCKPRISKIQTFVLSFLLGMFLSVFSVYILSIFKIYLSLIAVFVVLISLTILTNIQFKNRIESIKLLFKNILFSFKFYHLPFFFFLSYILLMSFWRVYYLPVISYDTINGIDLIAKFAVKEGSIFNSIFDKSIIKGLSTQTYYAPFASFSQIVYRLLGFPFGQFWLGLVTLSFVVFLYTKISEWTHPLLAGVICMFAYMMPEFYAYSFILQTDYTNAVFFCISIAYFYEYWIGDNQKDKLWISALMMMLACWTRSETIFFVPFGAVSILLKEYPVSKIKAFVPLFIYGLISSIGIFCWNIIMFKFYFSDPPSFAKEIRDLSDISFSSYINILKDINEKVVFVDEMWSYTIYIFLFILALNLLIFRDKQSLIIVYWITVVYLVFGLLKLCLIHVEIPLTVRRGYFKILLMMFLYIPATTMGQKIGKLIKNWEIN